MNEPRILDLFCCAGGAAVGYHNAGFICVGIDIKPQPHYPFPFILGDALDIFKRMIDGEKFQASDGNWYGINDFVAVHASPMCQGYSVTQNIHGIDYPMQIEPTRELLVKSGKPYVIENVPGAPLESPIELCGVMFGLHVLRHRLFESNMFILTPPHSHRGLKVNTNSKHGYSARRLGANYITVAGHNFDPIDGAWAMGIDWMTREELAEAIPPAYTEFIGKSLIAMCVDYNKYA